MVHDRARIGLVRIQHWGFTTQQVLTQQLRLQVPDLSNHVSHDGLLAPQLRRYRVDEASAAADDQVSCSVLEDRGFELGVLYVGGEWEHLAEVPSGVV